MKLTLKSLTILLLPVIWQSCLPDRMAPDPVQIARPEFLGFAQADSGGVNVPLDHQVTMIFDVKMNLNTFAGNFTMESVSGEISGTFSCQPGADTVVIFSPLEEMNQAEIYTSSVYGGVRDIYGNSKLSPNDADIPEQTWMFTTGQYAENGFPHVYFVDKNGENLFLVGEIDNYRSSTIITDQPTSGSGKIRITPNGAKLVIANRLAAGTISIFDPATISEITTVAVGVGPENIFLTNDIAYVVNLSARTISVVDLNTYTELSVLSFTDGFRPLDIVYSNKTNKLYVSSNVNGDFGKIRIIDADDFNTFYDISNVWDNSKKTVDMEISQDGEYIFIAEFNSTKLHVFSTSVDSIVQTFDHGTTKNEDGTISENFYYLVSNNGTVFKMDIESQLIVTELQLDRTSLAISVTAADEMLYVVTPQDSTAQIIETSTMTRLNEAKVPGDLRRVATSILNYQ